MEKIGKNILNRTFRLFVSSTFSDFSVERRLLQEYVFPEIKKYCKDSNLNFQPIDLRWGVSNEAQLDQKTLELCLEEVRTSKINPHPNFLIMIGDRYGWIPLPYLIEKSEYETILSNIEKTKDIELLNNWYKLDENQIPASYILKERENKFANDKVWEKLENHLRAILQNSVIKSSLSKENKERYFMSATEHEVVEGIFKYLRITPLQQRILDNNKELLEIDSNHVYAYIRNIKSIDEKFKNDFIDIDSRNVDKFKKGIRKSITNSNILEVDIELTGINKETTNRSLLYNYQTIQNEQNSIFVKAMIENLKKSINTYKNSIKDLSDDDIEFLEHKNFKKVKINNFIGGEEALNVIDKYLNSSNNEALVVYGKSGLGKSSLMAKSIIDTQNKYINKKIVYRFVGSTINITKTSEILISILMELGIHEEVKKIFDSKNLIFKDEELDNFYKRVHDNLSLLKKEIVIFIDAVDQLENEDNFFWLPKELPDNLKIVISVLKDDNYKEDSKYFECIKYRTSNIYELPALDINNAKQLVTNLLGKHNRTISNKQINYLLDIYKNIKTPLYLVLVVQELKDWKITDVNLLLAKSQQEAIKSFINNLSNIHHHDKEFVQRVFIYISLTNGLSENELLELISIDKNFLNIIAPETYHTNITKELPIVIWARLYFQIKEFLKLKYIDNQNVMQFFHREFKEAIMYSKNEFEHLINLLEKIVIKHKHLPFSENRWIKIFLKAIEKYYIEYESNYDDIEYEDIFKYSIKIDEWNKTVLKYIFKENKKFYEFDPEGMLINYLECSKFLSKYFHFVSKYEISNNLDLKCNIILKKLYKTDNKLLNYYLINLESLANYYYHIDEEKKLSDLQKEILLIHQDLSVNNANWYDDYLDKLESQAFHFETINQYNESLKLRLEAFYLLKDLIKKDPILFIEKYSSSLNSVNKQLKDNGEIFDAIEVLIEKFKILDNLYQNNNEQYLEKYIQISINLVNSFIYINKFDEAIDLNKKVLTIFKTLYEENHNKYKDKYLESLSMLSNIYEKIGKYKEIVALQEKIIKIFYDLIQENPEKYISKYSESLHKQSTTLRKLGNIDEAINFEDKAIKIFDNFYKLNPIKYSSKYSESLRRQANILKEIGNIDEAKNFEDKAFEILKKLYSQDFMQWKDDYSSLIGLINYPPHEIYMESYIEDIKYGLNILDKLFEDNPHYWVLEYTNNLNSFINALLKANKYQDAKEFEKKLEKILS